VTGYICNIFQLLNKFCPHTQVSKCEYKICYGIISNYTLLFLNIYYLFIYIYLYLLFIRRLLQLWHTQTNSFIYQCLTSSDSDGVASSCFNFVIACSDSRDLSAVCRHRPPPLSLAERTAFSHASMRCDVTSSSSSSSSATAAQTTHDEPCGAHCPQPRFNARRRHLAAVVNSLFRRSLVGRFAQKLSELGQVAVRVKQRLAYLLPRGGRRLSLLEWIVI